MFLPAACFLRSSDGAVALSSQVLGADKKQKSEEKLKIKSSNKEEIEKDMVCFPSVLISKGHRPDPSVMGWLRWIQPVDGGWWFPNFGVC